MLGSKPPFLTSGVCQSDLPPVQGSWAGPVFGGMPSQRIFCNDTLPASQVGQQAQHCAAAAALRMAMQLAAKGEHKTANLS